MSIVVHVSPHHHIYEFLINDSGILSELYHVTFWQYQLSQSHRPRLCNFHMIYDHDIIDLELHLTDHHGNQQVTHLLARLATVHVN